MGILDPKPPTRTELSDTYVPQSARGAASGVAALDSMGKLPDTQVPDRLLQAGLEAVFAVRAKFAPNILDYGVTRDTPTSNTTSQTAAVKAAFDANPGKEFYFPDGDYRFDTNLLITKGNSILLHKDARLYAGTPMIELITYSFTGSGYAEDKGICGGLLDGALKANKVMTLQKVIHFTLAHTQFADGINRGLQTIAGLGAELIAYDLRLYNTTATNVSDNIAIEANMGDSHFRDIIIRDWTTAVKDTAANRWDRVHPWISQDTQAAPQMTNRYPTSIAFDLTGSSDLQACVSDTYRTAYKFRTNGTGYTAPPRLLNCRAMWANDPILPTALATANPAYCFDNSDGVGVISDRFTATGSTTAPANFLTGPTTNLISRRSYSYGYVKGAQGTTSDSLDYTGGIQQGTFTFTPTIYGSTGAGTHTYNSRSGRMVVNGDEVTYYVRINATLDATTGFAGSFRVGGIPLPNGATNVRDGAGNVGYGTNIQAFGAVIFAGTAPYITVVAPPTATGTAEVDIPGQSLRGKTVDIMLAVTVTHYKA